MSDPARAAAALDITGLANPLRMLRLHRGLTLAQCAWLAKVTLNRYGGWERRPTAPLHLPAAAALIELLRTTARADIEPRLEGFSKWHRHAGAAAAQRVARFASLHVMFQLPAGATQADARRYVKDALSSHKGGLDPMEDRMFDLDEDTIKVRHAWVGPPTKEKTDD